MIDSEISTQFMSVEDLKPYTVTEEPAEEETVALGWTDEEKIAMLEEDYAILQTALKRIIRTQPHQYTVVPGGTPTIVRASRDMQQIATETLDLLQEKAYERTIRKIVANGA